jgi:hypothetical protein
LKGKRKDREEFWFFTADGKIVALFVHGKEYQQQQPVAVFFDDCM